MCKSKSKTKTTSEIAKDLNVSTSTVTRFAQKHNIKPVQITQSNAKHYYISDFEALRKKHKSTEKQLEKPKKNSIVDQLNLRIKEQQARISDLNNTIETLNKQLDVKDRQIEMANRLIDQAQRLDLTTHQQTQKPVEKENINNKQSQEEPSHTKHNFWYKLFHSEEKE